MMCSTGRWFPYYCCRRLGVRRDRRDRLEYRSDTVLHLPGDLPDYASHGVGWPTATADLTVVVAVTWGKLSALVASCPEY